MSGDSKPTIVIDLGSAETKAGFAEEELPTYTLPSVVSQDKENKVTLLGSNALGQTNITYPIEHGQVKDWEAIEQIFGDVFRGLDVVCQDHPLLLTQPANNPKRDKEKLAEILFEVFDVSALYEEMQAVLSLYSSGRHAGLIVESGHGVTSVVPILSGYAISKAILRLDIGGGELDKYLVQLLNNRGYNVPLEVARDIKEKCCYSDEGTSYPDTESYKLPDGQVIHLGQERTQCPQALFDPTLVEQYESQGIHEMVYRSIMNCDIDLRRDFANNIVLSGGTTLLKDFEHRLKTELDTRVSLSMRISIMADKDRKYYVWRGGSILGSLSTFRNVCVSKKEYDEYGISTVAKKFMNGLS
ncbi:actin-like [Cylas formicarius]|uniref:actin-like n=1 Tax=Cylas formicarius TaxID=197179 RepID=UPI0029584888|nr:actin-like [Cylas formicarius]XP_060522900.1 actin-like [Cylas formicarius]